VQVKLRAFAALRDSLGFGETTLEVPAGTRVDQLIAQLVREHPAAGLGERTFSVAVNRAFTGRDRELSEGDEIALIPPVSGG
jgi:molybdopterin converting factor subunit 1